MLPRLPRFCSLKVSIVSALILICKSTVAAAASEQYLTTYSGPVIGVTLHDNGSDTPWSGIDLSSLNPSIMFGFTSSQQQVTPLDNTDDDNNYDWLLPVAVKGTISANYKESKRINNNDKNTLGSQGITSVLLETAAKWRHPTLPGDFLIQPSLNLIRQRLAKQASSQFAISDHSIMVQVQRKASFILGKFKLSSISNISTRDKATVDFNTAVQNFPISCQSLQSSINLQLPYAPHVRAVRFAPTIDFTDSTRSRCIVEVLMGSASRTKAVLDYNYNDPTLAIWHSLDENNTIAPEISLYDAKIKYSWFVRFRNSHIQATVDPVNDITVKWTDAVDSSSSGNKWVTNIRLPLQGTSMQALKAEVRVQRMFAF